MNRLLAVVVVLALATPVMAEQIENGSFEDSSGGTAWVTSIADWTLAPSTTVAGQTAGIFFGMGGYSPTDGSKFGVFSNNGGVSQTVSTASFKITNARVDFDWIYITENALGDTTHKDPFTVTLTTTDSMGAVSSTTWTVSDVDDSNLAAGSVGNSPWSPSATTYDTGEWQTFSIDTSSLTGLTGVVTFSAVDSATGGQVSGFILDDVTHVPEPGTFLLFGLGFVGMALYGRRKMKKQK